MSLFVCRKRKDELMQCYGVLLDHCSSGCCPLDSRSKGAASVAAAPVWMLLSRSPLPWRCSYGSCSCVNAALPQPAPMALLLWLLLPRVCCSPAARSHDAASMAAAPA